jgi:two-component system, cell cycle response regulator CtrA
MPETFQMRILVAEGNFITAQVISRVLQARGVIVEQTERGKDALELVKRYDFDLVMLDLTLPDMEAYEVVRRMRAVRLNTPVLILSGVSRPAAQLKAFEMGADEFMTKPFDNAELLARVQAVIRRSKGFSQPCVQFGPVTLDLNSRVVTINGKVVKFSKKEFSILELMILRRGTVLTKEAFLSHLYDGRNEPDMKIIDVFICKMRKKLADAGAKELIETIWGRGYMMRHSLAATYERATLCMTPVQESAMVEAA